MNSKNIILISAGLLIALTGCESGKFTHYVSPRVIGRVLAADTREPLAHVSVQRAGANGNFQPSGSSKGGQMLMQPSGARTDANGEFVLESKSVLALFRQPGWSSVSVTFSHSGYETLRTNFTGANAVSQTDAGVPVINTGDVLLQPLGK